MRDEIDRRVCEPPPFTRDPVAVVRDEGLALAPFPARRCCGFVLIKNRFAHFPIGKSCRKGRPD